MPPLLTGPLMVLLQIGCVQLGDPVAARFHWPRFADLRVNSMSFRPYARQVNIKVGNNIRDDPANIGVCPCLAAPCIIRLARRIVTASRPEGIAACAMQYSVQSPIL